MNQDRTKRKLTAIFSADVVGYSRLMEEDEAWTIKTLEEDKRLISGLVEEYEGRVVDAPGDNILAEFSSVTNAVECAVKIQQELKKKNANIVENRRMEFRIGINLGEIIEEGGRIYGSGVNIAARIEGLSKSGGICISGRAYDHIKTRFDFGYEYLGEHEVKNISEPVRVYRVLTGFETAGKVIGEKKISGGTSRKISIAAIIILIIIAAGSISWIIYSHKERKIETASIEPEQSPAVSDIEKAKKTIAVLPFENLSSDPEQVYFVDGLSEEILNSLCQIPDLNVIGRTSSFSFKGSNKTVQEIASVLGSDHILEGSVRKAGNALRITAQLLRATDGVHLWSKIYDRQLNDIFAVQEDIATAVAGELKIALGIGKSLKQLGSTENEKAYEYYLIAKGQQFDPTGISHALESINAAIAMDPKFARAWALKATLHIIQSVYGPSDLADSQREEALYAAQKAVDMDPDLAAGYVSLGFTKMSKGEWIGAEPDFRKALELSAETLSSDEIIYASLYYMGVGYFQKAYDLLAEYRRNDPLNANLRAIYFFPLVFIGDNQRAEEEFEYGTELYGDQWIGKWFYICSVISPGIKAPIDPDKIDVTLVQFRILAIGVKNFESPKKGLMELRQIYQDEKNLSGVGFNTISTFAAYLGDHDFAMDAMEKGYEIDPGGLDLAWLPVKMEVRQLPRFKEFVREIGLVDYWNEFGWPDICHQLDNGDFECD